MAKIISILGCGWLGTALGKSLLWKGYIVKGSTASTASCNALETTGIGTFHIKVEPDSMAVDYTSFFNADVLVISIPPKRVGKYRTNISPANSTNHSVYKKAEH